MRKYIYFTSNEKIKKLLSQFDLNEGELYHYTTLESAKAIKTNRELWLTRADCTLDPSEIQYGIDILISSAKRTLSKEELEKFIELLNIIGPKLKKSYLFCLTENKNSNRHIDTHGNTLMTFQYDFPELLLSSGRLFNHINTKERAVTFIKDSFCLIEGKVIYDFDRQNRIADSICNFYKAALVNNMHIVEINLFTDVLLQFIILLKEQCYSWENEYRICIVKTENHTNFDIEAPSEKIVNKVHFATIEFDEIYYA